MGDQQEEVTEKRKKLEEQKRETEGSSSGGMEREKRVAMVVSSNTDHTSQHPHPHHHHPCRVYPPPLLSHVDVSTDTAAFFEALQKFHSAMGTRFMVPVIGGKELNLHQLYVQVTQRGGLEKVIMERMWREVIATFNFPPTTTSASFVLRKYYLNLLYHFEQVYFFRAQGPLIPPPGILQTKTPLSKLDPGLHHSSSSASDSTMRRKMAIPLSSGGVVPLPPQTVNGTGYVSSGSSQRIPAAGESIPATGGHLLLNGHDNGVGASGSVPIATGSGERTPPGTHSFTVTGTIDGKFEHGYFVTVKIGSQVLHGVLYHVHPETASYSSLNQPNHQPPGAPSSSAPVSSTAIVPYIPPTRSVRRRLRHRNRDPSHPKPNRSAYNFFFAEKHSKLKALYPHQERQYSRMIGESWSKLTEEERKVYDDYGKRDKDRYRRELQEYKERLRLVSLREIVRPMDVVREDVRKNEIVRPMMKEVEMGESSEVKKGD